MTISLRTFVVDPDDTLYRLTNAKFSRIHDDPENHRLERFAGQRVRMIEAIVELWGRTPCRIVRLLYLMLPFDAEGRLDRHAIRRQNLALPDLVAFKAQKRDTKIVDASSRFIARGGRWRPSASLEQRILRVVLGEVKCKRL